MGRPQGLAPPLPPGPGSPHCASSGQPLQSHMKLHTASRGGLQWLGTQAQPGDPVTSRDSQVARGGEVCCFPAQRPLRVGHPGISGGRARRSCREEARNPWRTAPWGPLSGPGGQVWPWRGWLSGWSAWVCEGLRIPDMGPSPERKTEVQHYSGGAAAGWARPSQAPPRWRVPARVCLQGPLVLEPGWRLGQGRLDAGPYPSRAIPRTPRACLAFPLQAIPGPCPSFPADPAASPPDVPALGAGPATHPGA